jgi:hypothetical protein
MTASLICANAKSYIEAIAHPADFGMIAELP